jgi:tRNA A37 threonylcarbamoyladenosine synthetase subunit TsaC/SUA5/YrdC
MLMEEAMEQLFQSIRDLRACTEAARQVASGEVVGSYIRGVCGLWIDGGSSEAIDRIDEIKGEKRANRPFGTTLDGAEFSQLIDPEQIAPSARDLFLDGDRLRSRLGSLCFIRIPIRKQIGSKLPPRLISQTEDGTYWLQNWIPWGSRSSTLWMEALQRQNVEFPSATSMNVSGTPELVEQEAGVEFCNLHRISVFLGDPESRYEVKGSFPILQVDKTGIRLLREGHFPGILFRYLLQEWDIDLSDYKRTKYPLVRIPEEWQSGILVGDPLRLALIEHIDS